MGEWVLWWARQEPVAGEQRELLRQMTSSRNPNQENQRPQGDDRAEGADWVQRYAAQRSQPDPLVLAAPGNLNHFPGGAAD